MPMLLAAAAAAAIACPIPPGGGMITEFLYPSIVLRDETGKGEMSVDTAKLGTRVPIGAANALGQIGLCYQGKGYRVRLSEVTTKDVPKAPCGKLAMNVRKVDTGTGATRMGAVSGVSGDDHQRCPQ